MLIVTTACRKRRIKCGEERPRCGNCVKSKRQCEGYNQRVIFKDPLSALRFPSTETSLNSTAHQDTPKKLVMFPLALYSTNFPCSQGKEQKSHCTLPIEELIPSTDNKGHAIRNVDSHPASPAPQHTIEPESACRLEDWSSDLAAECDSDDSDTSTIHVLSRLLSDQKSCDSVKFDNDTIRPNLETAKQALIDRIMEDFYDVFDHDWTSNVKSCGDQSPGSSYKQSDNGHSSNSLASQIPSKKHGRKPEENKDQDDDDSKDNFPKRPRSTFKSPYREEMIKFACPFRKHDPRRYDVHIAAHRSCALSHWDTVARIK
jgi:Fungal Zn(2)-Cys(6) binuclear cluster domain